MTLASTPTRLGRRLRLLAVLQGILIVGSLIAPLSAFAAISSVTIGAQAPNPVTPGNDATYSVTVTRDTNNAVRVSAVSGLPTGATFTSSCDTGGAATVILTLTIHTTVATPGGTSTITPTVREANNSGCGNNSGDTWTSTTASLVVGMANQTITFPALADVRLDQAPPVPAATASSGLAVTYSTASAACSVTGAGVITLLHVGTCTIAADQAGNGTWNAAPQQSQSFTVSKGDQTITFAAIPTKTLADSPLTIGATASSGLAVSFGSATTLAVCTVSGTSVTLLTTGTCTIDANQAGNADWNAAPQVSRSFTVTTANQTITFPALADVRLDQAPPVPAATASSGLAVTYSTASAACSVTGAGVITLLHVGTCTIAADQAGNGTWNAAPQQSQSFTVSKGDQTITFAAIPTKTLADSPLTIGATASSGLAVSFGSATTLAVCTVSGTSVTLLTTGTCTIDANQAGNADWNAAPQVSRSFTVTTANQTITFPALADVRLDQAPPVPAATASSGLAVTYSTASAACSVTGAGVITLLHVGTCTIAADQAGNGTWNAAPQQSQSFTVSKGDQTITFAAIPTKTLADSPLTIGATASSGLAVSFGSATTLAVCTVSGTSVTLLTTGTCTIDANQAGNADWNAAPQVSRSFTVTTANQTITFPALADVRLDQAPPVPAATASSGLAVTYSTASAACSVTGAGVITLLHVGTCTIAADQAGNGTWNAAPQQSQSFTVSKGDQTITFAAIPTKTLADSPLTIGATASSGLAVSFGSATTLAVCTVSGTSVTLLTTGTCTIDANQAGNADWNAAPQVSRSFTVTTANQTITFPALADVRLDQAPPVPAATASSGLAVTYSTASAACSVTGAGVITLLHVGTCTIAADQAGNGTWNAAPQQSQSFTVSKGDQTITFAAIPTKTLADSPLTIGATASSGLAVSFGSATTLAVCTVSGTSVTLLTTGTCTIDANQAGNADWNAAPQVSRSFTVTTANQTITFPALADVRLDQAPPVPAATASSGLAVTYSTASAACSVTGAGVITLLHVGTCTIAADQAGNGTWNAAPQQSQSFTVSKGDQTITFAAIPTKTLADSPLTIGATASSGLAVSFGSATTLAVCTVSGTSVTLLTTGTCTIDANQAGNADWNAAPQVSRSFTVTTANQTITFPALADVRLDQAPPVPAATASSGLAVTYSTASAACSVTGAGVITLLHVGTCTIAADQAGNGTWNAAPQQSQSFTVSKGDQTITFAAIPTKTLADSPLTIGATASSGLAVSFGSATTLAVCTVSGTSVTLLTTGTCTIDANQAGNADWNAAPQVSRSFTVTNGPVPASLTLDKSTVPQGGKVVVTGQGYMPDDSVDVYLNSTPVLLTTVSTDGSGGFSVTVTIPTTTVVGAHTIEGLGLDPQGEPLSLTAAITVTSAGEQPATDTVLKAAGGAGVDPLPLGVLLLLLLVLCATAVALADPRRSRKR